MHTFRCKKVRVWFGAETGLTGQTLLGLLLSQDVGVQQQLQKQGMCLLCSAAHSTALGIPTAQDTHVEKPKMVSEASAEHFKSHFSGRSSLSHNNAPETPNVTPQTTLVKEPRGQRRCRCQSALGYAIMALLNNTPKVSCSR